MDSPLLYFGMGVLVGFALFGIMLAIVFWRHLSKIRVF